MNSITWLGFGFEEITKEFENANDLIAFMSKDDIKPYVIKAVINDSEFLKSKIIKVFDIYNMIWYNINIQQKENDYLWLKFY